MKNYVYDIYGRAKSIIEPVYLRNQSQKTKAILAVVVVCFFWGTTWLASKKGVQYMPALQLAGIRQFMAGSFFLGYFFIKGFKIPTRDQFIQFGWMSLLMIVINNGFSTWSMKYIPSGLGAVIGAASPLWIALLSTFVFKETRLNTMTIIGLLLGISGILIIFSDFLQDLFNSSFSVGVLLNLVASVTWALGTIFTVKNAKHINPYFSLGWQMFLGGVVLLTVAWFSNQYTPLHKVDTAVWYSIFYLVFVGSIITYSAFVFALKRLPAQQVSIYAYINPIVAVIVGALLNHEKLTMIIAAGTLVTIFGIYLVNTGFKRKARAESE
ncbi:MAG: EamA family transporter [Chitinophagaceae bacterium]|nr:EamA family transporter [Chitinophagaceae bacterium]